MTDDNRDRDRSGGAMLSLLLLGGLLVVGLIAGGATLYIVARSNARSADRDRAMLLAERQQAAADRDMLIMQGKALHQVKDLNALQIDPIPVDLSLITVVEAKQLEGRTLRVSFNLYACPDFQNGFEIYKVAGSDDEEIVERSVWFPAGRRASVKGTALATIRVIRHPPAMGADGTEFPNFEEVRVVIER